MRYAEQILQQEQRLQDFTVKRSAAAVPVVRTSFRMSARPSCDGRFGDIGLRLDDDAPSNNQMAISFEQGQPYFRTADRNGVTTNPTEPLARAIKEGSKMKNPGHDPYARCGLSILVKVFVSMIVAFLEIWRSLIPVMRSALSTSSSGFTCGLSVV